MAAWFSGVRSQAKDLWNNMSTTAKILVSGILIALVALGVGYSALSNKTTYTTLGNFSAQDAGQITSKLTEAKIPYQLGGDGFTILVPQDQIRQARLTLGVNGLPTGGVVGQEIFGSTTSLMTTQFERDVNFKRAIEGELTRAISSMDKVASARVLIAMPKESLFVRDQQEAKAMVMLQFKGTQRMGPDEVRSIMVSVSSAITGLKPENVVVTDTQSHVLSQGVAVGNSDAALSSTQLDAQQKISQYYQDQLQRQLESAVGPGNVAVTVAATLDFNRLSQESTTYTQGASGQPVLLSQQTTKETATTGGSTGGAAAGGNGVPTMGGTGGQAGASDVEKSSSVQNFQNNSQKVTTQTAPGTTPKSLAVTVLVNSDKVGAPEQANLDAVVQSFAKGIAAGVITPAVTVTAVKFNTDLADAVNKATQPPASTTPTSQAWLKYVGYGAVAAGLLLVVFLLRGRRGASMPEPAFAGAGGGGLTAGAALEMLAAAAQQPRPDDKSPAQRMLDLQEKAELLGEDFLAQLGVDPTKQKLRDEVEQLARDNPDKVASLLKSWIAEE